MFTRSGRSDEAWRLKLLRDDQRQMQQGGGWKGTQKDGDL